MKSYLKLVNFEVNRFFKLYVVLIGLTALVQFAGSAIIANGYIDQVNSQMTQYMMSNNQVMGQYPPFSFQQVIVSDWFLAPIWFCVAALMLYIFFIWYREWIGKNTFAYRLFTLPIERMTIYYAKLTTIMLFVLGLVAIQILLLAIETQIVQFIVPDDLRIDIPLQWLLTNNTLSILYPQLISEFLFMYGIGLVFVSVLFTAILLERSYRWKGITVGILYGVAAFLLFIAPVLLNDIVWDYYFYPTEQFAMMVVASLIIVSSAIWIARYLLKYKLKV